MKYAIGNSVKGKALEEVSPAVKMRNPAGAVLSQRCRKGVKVGPKLINSHVHGEGNK